MSRKLPPLNALRAFEAAGRHQSFSKAAQELNVSHSAISRHVRGLEARLQVNLFQSESRGVKLSAQGARYLAEVTQIFDAIAQATEDISNQSADQVILSCEPVFANKVLLPVLSEFYAAYPNVDLQIDATTTLIDMGHYEADLAIRFFHEDPGDSVGPLISDAPMYPFAAPGLVSGGVQDPRDLLQFRIYKDRQNFDLGDWFGAFDLDMSDAVIIENKLRADLALEAALAGLGVLFASAEITANDVAQGRLVRCFDRPFHRGCYRLLTGEAARRRRTIRDFSTWLLNETAMFRENSGPKAAGAT